MNGMSSNILSIFLLFIASAIAGFTAASGSRAGAGNSIKLAWGFRIAAHASWLFLFKDLISKNVLNVPDLMFYPAYIGGYSLGQILSQYLFINFIKGKASVGGVKELEQRVKLLEERGSSDAMH